MISMIFRLSANQIRKISVPGAVKIYIPDDPNTPALILNEKNETLKHITIAEAFKL